ncbi:hypothetical protein ACFQ34_15745 [Pseudonocardia benzenivorans]|jgi:hypothetical protein|uniref:Uncharacterized protein n=2 Tax=Pseudonocardia TaxID=1847 RepID=F4CIV7_PSEUX|nr:hypothetical protein [Pseudonocardia dioxanivorans]AEA22936.1 hypothetical protein Psed_0673 [Pseudonocardia dioxanivorans CB1190]GJF05038.1 hypothetical protein PSD17_39910 [Pseudonocardia sp. D17]
MGIPESTVELVADGKSIPIGSRPGTEEALGLGCRCPVLVNGPATASGDLLVAPDCGIHSADERR